MNLEQKFRELLLPVFGLESIDEVKLEFSLVKDLGADSLDFVEIFHLIERDFGVEITANTIMVGNKDIKTDDLFDNGKLTVEGLELLQQTFASKKDQLAKGMTKVDLFSLITVKDLAEIIEINIKKGNDNAPK